MGRAGLPGRKELGGHAESLAEKMKDLERRRSRTGLDARDVCGRAAGEGELALAEADGLARFLQTNPYRSRIVNMC